MEYFIPYTFFLVYSIAVAPIMQLGMCIMKMVHFQVKSPNVEIRFFQP